jgi:hypothetical protein
MPTLGFWVLPSLLLCFLLSWNATAESTCPITAENETTLDCPWAAIARDLIPAYEGVEDRTEATKRTVAALSEKASDFWKRLAADAKKTGRAKQLWGRSLNYDEFAKGMIVPEPVIDAILERARVPTRGHGIRTALAPRVVHAGVEHTYGYLLSNLKTPYGYKRLRWVRPDIEKGFGLAEDSISPTPKDGGLLANVTYFAGRIAFRGGHPAEKKARQILDQMGGVSKSIRSYGYGGLHGRRLKETLILSENRTVEIRTDFIPFTAASGEATGGNTELLIYSVRDGAEKLPYLVTAFPIAKGFSDTALDAKNLGSGKPISTRYNLFVPGVTDVKRVFEGKREAEAF